MNADTITAAAIAITAAIALYAAWKLADRQDNLKRLANEHRKDEQRNNRHMQPMTTTTTNGTPRGVEPATTADHITYGKEIAELTVENLPIRIPKPVSPPPEHRPQRDNTRGQLTASRALNRELMTDIAGQDDMIIAQDEYIHRLEQQLQQRPIPIDPIIAALRHGPMSTEPLKIHLNTDRATLNRYLAALITIHPPNRLVDFKDLDDGKRIFYLTEHHIDEWLNTPDHHYTEQELLDPYPELTP